MDLGARDIYELEISLGVDPEKNYENLQGRLDQQLIYFQKDTPREVFIFEAVLFFSEEKILTQLGCRFAAVVRDGAIFQSLGASNEIASSNLCGSRIERPIEVQTSHLSICVTLSG